MRCLGDSAACTPAISWHKHNVHEDAVGTSYCNDMEIEMIINLINTKRELDAEQLRITSETLVVIAFYSEQVRRLQAQLANIRSDVQVMTVDAAQGSEADYVVLSCVRANHFNSIGHAADERRFNVAMSRARKKLFIVGSTQTLVRPWGDKRREGGAGLGEEVKADLWYDFKQHVDAIARTAGATRGARRAAAHDGAQQERYALHKVKLCNNFSSNGSVCPFGNTCVFAHGAAELRCRARAHSHTHATQPDFMSRASGCVTLGAFLV